MARMESIYKDGNDTITTNTGRFRPPPNQPAQGVCVSWEFGQHNPFFFTREKAEYLGLIGSYRGSSAFLIAGGPSFKGIDKQKLRLPGVWTMTINNATTSFRGNANIIVDEPQRFNMSTFLDPAIQKFVPIDHFESKLWDNRLVQDFNGNPVQMWELSDIVVGECPNVVGYRRNEKVAPWRFLYEDTINWGNHQDICLCGKGQRNNRGDPCPSCGRTGQFGGRSVMMSAFRVLFLLGFRTVYLLGVDFDMSPEKKYHFSEERHTGAINCNNSTYEKLQVWLAQLRPYFEAERFRVVNCNMQSKLDAFDKMPFEQALKEATEHIGDPIKERTMGMYADLAQKRGIPQPPQRDPYTTTPPTTPPTPTPTPTTPPTPISPLPSPSPLRPLLPGGPIPSAALPPPEIKITY